MASNSARDLLHVLSCTFDREEEVTEETERFSKVFEKSSCSKSIKELERGCCSSVDQASLAVLDSLRQEESEAQKDDDTTEAGEEATASTPLEECSRYAKNIEERLRTALKRANEVRGEELEPNEKAKQKEIEEREKQLWRDLWQHSVQKQENREEASQETSQL